MTAINGHGQACASRGPPQKGLRRPVVLQQGPQVIGPDVLLAALAAATATPTPCDACDGHGEHGHGPDAVECRACGCTGERLVSAWDEDRDSARRREFGAERSPRPTFLSQVGAVSLGEERDHLLDLHDLR